MVYYICCTYHDLPETSTLFIQGADNPLNSKALASTKCPPTIKVGLLGSHWTLRCSFFQCSRSKFIFILQQETSRHWLFFFFFPTLFSWQNRQQYKLQEWLLVWLRPYKVQASSCKLWIWVLKMKRIPLPRTYETQKKIIYAWALFP